MMFWLLAAVQARGPFQKVSLAKALGLPNSDNPVLLWPSQKFTCPFCFILFFFTFAVVIEGISHVLSVKQFQSAGWEGGLGVKPAGVSGLW